MPESENVASKPAVYVVVTTTATRATTVFRSMPLLTNWRRASPLIFLWIRNQEPEAAAAPDEFCKQRIHGAVGVKIGIRLPD